MKLFKYFPLLVSMAKFLSCAPSQGRNKEKHMRNGSVGDWFWAFHSNLSIYPVMERKFGQLKQHKQELMKRAWSLSSLPLHCFIR